MPSIETSSIITFALTLDANVRFCSTSVGGTGSLQSGIVRRVARHRHRLSGPIRKRVSLSDSFLITPNVEGLLKVVSGQEHPTDTSTMAVYEALKQTNPMSAGRSFAGARPSPESPFSVWIHSSALSALNEDGKKFRPLIRLVVIQNRRIVNIFFSVRECEPGMGL